AELVGIVGLGGVEDQLEYAEAAARELVTARDLVARLGLDRVTIGTLDALPFRPELLDDEARARLDQREGAVGVVAERLAEVRRAVPGGARVDHRLHLEVLLPRLAPEEDRVLVARDVVQDVGL